jgi:hypothetical protein
MVNSTAFKALEPFWPFVIHQFYVDCVAAVQPIGFRVWKYVGDEVLFWRFVEATEDLPALVRTLHETVGVLRAKLDEIHGRHGIHTHNLIGVKGTVWIAPAEFVAQGNLEKHVGMKHSHVCRIIQEGIAVATVQKSSDLLPLVDFIGTEIDIGFRIAKFAHNGFLLMNAPLAALLLNQTREDSIPARIVSFEPLKGVWGGRPYPIVWYHAPWDHCEENFAYDELLSSPLVARVVADQTQPLRLINKVLRDANQEGISELLAQYFRH